MLETLKGQMVAVARKVERLGICRHRSNNFSIFDPGIGYVVTTPSGAARDVLGMEHICVMNLRDKVVEGTTKVKPSSEAIVCLYAYKERKDIRAIVYIHACYSAIFFIMNKLIIPIVYKCAYLGKTEMILMAPYGGAGIVDLVRRVAEVIGEYGCYFMESHRIIAADRDVDAASLKAQCVEEIAEVYYITLIVGNGAEPHALPVEGLQK